MQIDVSGTVCPQPVRIVRRCLAELNPGDELVVTGDYPPAERSIRRTCYKHGYHVTTAPEAAETDHSFAVRIRVTDRSESATETPLPRH